MIIAPMNSKARSGQDLSPRTSPVCLFLPTRRLQSLQQLVKCLVVLDRVLIPAAEIADDFAEDIRLAPVFPGVGNVIVDAKEDDSFSLVFGV
jgi:hypothetical protein